MKFLFNNTKQIYETRKRKESALQNGPLPLNESIHNLPHIFHETHFFLFLDDYDALYVQNMPIAGES